ncbi:MAG: hypothetical protein REI94_14215 [Moraxellaceae bacterium]|nr:hypothetical protein [Moraxellaceae bacterium]
MTKAASIWRVLAQHSALPDDWREQLVQRLGERPRRVGLFAELSLFGATACLAQVGLKALPPQSLLRLASRSSCATATASALAQMADGAPQPFTFLQSQPGQSLAALSRCLRWQGDAAFLVDDALAMPASLACHEAEGRGLLLGWVNDLPVPESRWYWLRQSDDPALPAFDIGALRD